MGNLLTQLAQTPLTGVSRIVSKINTLWLSKTYPFVAFGKGSWFHHSVELSREKSAFVIVGDEVMVHQNVWLNIAPESVSKEPIIILGSRSTLGRNCMISAQNQISVGRNTIFGPSVLLMDHNHMFEEVNIPIRDQGTTPGGKIHIGADCWLGFGAAVLCNTGELEIGDHCVIAANSVVTRSFPAYSVIAGNPAKVVKQYDPVKQAWVIGSARVTQPEAQLVLQ
jgi:acetyltransferase-like isoleucine patch superfamily enzyme